jgi:methionine sulfoxide reductase heme-binding subunit
MSTLDKYQNKKKTSTPTQKFVRVLWGSFFLALIAFVTFVILTFANTPAGQAVTKTAVWLLSANTTQTTWFITRAAGITAYLLLWLSTAWGLAVSTRVLDGRLHGSYTYDFHQFISLLSIAFVALHIIVLLFDQYLPFSIIQVLLPFTSQYRPLWVGVGIISLWIVLLVTVTFYIRDRIGSSAFRKIHVLSLLGFFGAAAHGLFSGTDSPLLAIQAMYVITSLSVVFLLTYWFVMLVTKRQAAQQRINS